MENEPVLFYNTKKSAINYW